MQFLILQLTCMLLVSYDLFITNNYSQKYYVLQQKFLGTMMAWHPAFVKLWLIWPLSTTIKCTIYITYGI